MPKENELEWLGIKRSQLILVHSTSHFTKFNICTNNEDDTINYTLPTSHFILTAQKCIRKGFFFFWRTRKGYFYLLTYLWLGFGWIEREGRPNILNMLWCYYSLGHTVLLYLQNFRQLYLQNLRQFWPPFLYQEMTSHYFGQGPWW